MSLIKLTQNRMMCPILMRHFKKIQIVGKKFSSQEPNTNALQQGAVAGVAKQEYKTVYQFQYIKEMHLVGKLKLYLSAFSGIMISGCCVLNLIGFCTPSDVASAIGLTIGGLVPIYTIGFLGQNLVGFVYLHNREDKAKVAYLDFWGNRKEQELLIKDIIPFEQMPGSITDRLYMKIKLNSSKEEMKIFTKYGAAIFDRKSFNKIF